MNQPQHSQPTPTPVSTVTKHIKIYSDNPIHDCIDRIIDACDRIDSREGNHADFLVLLIQASYELAELGIYRLNQENRQP